MSFSAFSKEFTANMFTAVENQFITKYLPQANGDAVRVYLYGLYLCNCKDEFDGETLAKMLRIPYQSVIDIFTFWEECDLVHVLSRNPLYVEYLPVNSAVGKPKLVRPEKYAQFNRELMMILQKAGKDFKPYEMQKILEFMENNPIEQQAFLLIAEYCAQKDGEKLSCAHILNKAKKLCDEHKYTYDLAEKELADFNSNEKDIAKLFSLLGIYKKPQESDYDYLAKWKNSGMDISALCECAKTLKKGTFASLDLIVGELLERQITTVKEIKEYFVQREKRANVVYAVARKLSVKIQNPRAYIEEYADKWLERGYDEDGLTTLSSLTFKLGYGFPETDALLDTLFKESIVNFNDVKAYCQTREKQLKILHLVQSICGVVKKTMSALDMIAVWQSWGFVESMILEAAKRSATASAPLPYMNKLLSEWKRLEITTPNAIPEKTVTTSPKTDYKNEAVIAADLRAEREHFYSVRKQKALDNAEKAKKRAETDKEFKDTDSALKKCEIELAKAEVFQPDKVDAIFEKIRQLQTKRANSLLRLGITEEDFLPKFECKKCSDSGFLPSGKICDCYKA